MPKPSAESVLQRCGINTTHRGVADSAIAAMDAHYAELVEAARDALYVVDLSLDKDRLVTVEFTVKVRDALAAALRGLE